MKHLKKLAAAVILIGLLASKFLRPELGGDIRERLDSMIENEVDGVAAFAERLNLLSSAQNPDAEKDEHHEAPETTTKPSFIFVDVVSSPELPITTEAQNDVVVTPVPTEEPVEITPEPLPAAVAAFLESQESFAEYEIPEKVNYNYISLPFEYVVPVVGYNSSGFGYRLHPILNTVRFHYGTDFAAYSGEKVLAFAEGIVTFAGYDESFGWHVRIRHGDDLETLYAHCSQLYVTVGEEVTAGECIALVGASGLATGPHLHFELTLDGKYLNPEYYINS